MGNLMRMNLVYNIYPRCILNVYNNLVNILGHRMMYFIVCDRVAPCGRNPIQILKRM